MKNLILFNSTTISWIDSISNNWAEILSNGIFTLIGTAVGAFLAGKYAINAVKKELKYNQQTIHLEKANNSLMILTSFLHNISISVSKTQKNKELFVKYKNNEKPFKTVLIESLEETVHTISNDLNELRKIQLQQSTPEEYKIYLLIIDVLTMIKMQLKVLNFELNSINVRQEIYKNHIYLEIIKYTDKLTEYESNLLEKEKELDERRLELDKNLNNMTN